MFVVEEARLREEEEKKEQEERERLEREEKERLWEAVCMIFFILFIITNNFIIKFFLFCC